MGEIEINIKNIALKGLLEIPDNPKALIIFVHGSGSGRLSPRNKFVASSLNQKGFATLLFDLLTEEEDAIDLYTTEYRFNIDLLSKRLGEVTDWASSEKLGLRYLKKGYFGASTGAAAALDAASERDDIYAIVSRGGRPDLAKKDLSNLKSAVLFIVGEKDQPVVTYNEEALENIKGPKKLSIIKNATHLFEEKGALEEITVLANEWFLEHL